MPPSTTPTTTTRSRSSNPAAASGQTREARRDSLTRVFTADPYAKRRHESPAAAADRNLAAEALDGTAGKLQLGYIVRTALELEDLLRGFLDEHGPTARSSVARYVREHGDTAFYDNLRAMLWNVTNSREFLNGGDLGDN